MRFLFIFLVIYFIAWNQLGMKKVTYFEKKQKLENDTAPKGPSLFLTSVVGSLNQNKPAVRIVANNSKEKAFPKTKKGRQEVSAEKEDLLPKNFYEPKQTKEELKKGLKAHLDKLAKNCSLDKTNKSRNLKKKIESLKKYLADSLKDPYMDHETALLFADILSVVEEDTIDTPDSFDMAYKLLYNIDETTQPKDYSHKWARILHDSVKCSQNINI